MSALAVEAAARGTVLCLIVWLAMKALRPRNPHLEKIVWVTVVMGSLALPLLITLNVVPAIQTQYILVLPALPVSVTETFKNHADVFLFLYSLIALALVLRFSVAWVQMWRIRRDAKTLRFSAETLYDIRMSPRISSPATFGRTILLPPACSDWPASTWQAVLSHERAHVRRRDSYLQWLVHLHACIFWINPLAWWLQRRLSLLAENLSDDEAIAELGSRPAYAEVLLQLAAAQSPSPVSLAMAHCNVPARIERIISETSALSAPKLLQRILCVTWLMPVVAMAAMPFHECWFAFIGL